MLNSLKINAAQALFRRLPRPTAAGLRRGCLMIE